MDKRLFCYFPVMALNGKDVPLSMYKTAGAIRAVPMASTNKTRRQTRLALNRPETCLAYSVLHKGKVIRKVPNRALEAIKIFAQTCAMPDCLQDVCLTDFSWV